MSRHPAYSAGGRRNGPGVHHPKHRGHAPRHGVRRSGSSLFFHGRHAVRAALVNPRRRCRRLLATEQALAQLCEADILPPDLPVEEAGREEIAARLAPGTAHQGLLLEVEPLPPVPIETLCPSDDPSARVLVLDRVEDPMNVGAILRTAALFGVRGMITTNRHAPHESGALAKAAAGALEIVPWVRVANLVRALDRLAEMGYWRLALTTDAPQSLKHVDRPRPFALVLGAEGRGLRPLTRRHVDLEARIPTTTPQAPFNELIDSLNVSVSAGIALSALHPEA